MLQQDDDDGPEKTYKLSCGHLYPYLKGLSLKECKIDHPTALAILSHLALN